MGKVRPPALLRHWPCGSCPSLHVPTAYTGVFGDVGAQEITEGINDQRRVNVHCPVNAYEADLTTGCRVRLGNR